MSISIQINLTKHKTESKADGTGEHQVRVWLPSCCTVWTAVKTWVSIIARPVGRRKRNCSSVTSRLKAWACVLASMHLLYSIYCVLPLAARYTAQYIMSLTTANLRCSAVVPKNGTSILQTVFSVNKEQPLLCNCCWLTWHPSSAACRWVKVHQLKLVLCTVPLRMQSETNQAPCDYVMLSVAWKATWAEVWHSAHKCGLFELP